MWCSFFFAHRLARRRDVRRCCIRLSSQRRRRRLQQLRPLQMTLAMRRRRWHLAELAELQLADLQLRLQLLYLRLYALHLRHLLGRDCSSRHHCGGASRSSAGYETDLCLRLRASPLLASCSQLSLRVGTGHSLSLHRLQPHLCGDVLSALLQRHELR
jgi:hypothetical protein